VLEFCSNFSMSSDFERLALNNFTAPGGGFGGRSGLGGAAPPGWEIFPDNSSVDLDDTIWGSTFFEFSGDKLTGSACISLIGEVGFDELGVGGFARGFGTGGGSLVELEGTWGWGDSDCVEF